MAAERGLQNSSGWSGVVYGERYEALRIPISVVAYVTIFAHSVLQPTGPCAPRSLCSADAQWPPGDVEAAAGREGSSGAR